jgi:transcriptional regulator with XRE-family HTH domain
LISGQSIGSHRKTSRLMTAEVVVVGGIKLREWREQLALTQQELAERSGVGIATVSRIEQGQPALPSTRRKLAEALGMTPAQLLDGPPSR